MLSQSPRPIVIAFVKSALYDGSEGEGEGVGEGEGEGEGMGAGEGEGKGVDEGGLYGIEEEGSDGRSGPHHGSDSDGDSDSGLGNLDEVAGALWQDNNTPPSSSQAAAPLALSQAAAPFVRAVARTRTSSASPVMWHEEETEAKGVVFDSNKWRPVQHDQESPSVPPAPVSVPAAAAPHSPIFVPGWMPLPVAGLLGNATSVAQRVWQRFAVGPWTWATAVWQRFAPRAVVDHSSARPASPTRRTASSRPEVDVKRRAGGEGRR